MSGRSLTIRAMWAGSSAAAALLLLAFFLQPLGAAATLVLGGIALATIIRPFDTLLVVAAFAPLSTILFILFRIEASGLRLIEALTLAYLAGWAAHRAIRPSPLPVSSALTWSGVALIAAALASAVVSAAVILTQQGGGAALEAFDGWFRSYAVTLDAVVFALAFAEGVLLMLATADTCAGSGARREAAIRAMVVGAAAAAFFNLLRLVVDGALRHPAPWREFVNLFLNVRLNVHHPDLNAAGSYFALMWFPALGYAGRHRLAGAVCLLLVTTGLWTTGSRVAIAATAIVAAVLLVYRVVQRYRRKSIVVALVGSLVVIAAAGWSLLPQRHVADPSLALRIRMGLATGAVAMAADHPMFGVGLGHFYDVSASYVRVPNYVVRENAHNNFLQVLAELGASGFWLFLAVLWLALSAARNGAAEDTWPVVAGLTAFLLTCTGGHPLLVPHAAIPFWMAVGLAGSWPMAEPNRMFRVAAIALIALFAVTLPWRTSASLRAADLANASAGLSRWQIDDGRRFRWAGGHARFYVPSSVRSATFELRHGATAPAVLEVRIFLDGVEANRVQLRPGEPWKTVRLTLVRRSSSAFSRIDLEAGLPGSKTPLDLQASDAGGVLMVARPQFD